MQNLLHRRFDELDQQLETLIASIRPEYSSFHERMRQEVDDKLTLNWKVKAKSLLQAACGVDSQHLTIFVENETGSWSSSADILLRLAAVFRAAKEDFQGGYLESVRNLVRAEVFDSELEQSSELLRSGYFAAAAVICGTVLETAIRMLCAAHEVELGTLDRMNSELTKREVYNKLVQKRITTLAAIRNSAAHGRTDEFTTEDVSGMIGEVERFIAAHGV